MKPCPHCNTLINDSYFYCDKCINPKAFQIKKNHKCFTQKEAWEVAILIMRAEDRIKREIE